MRIVAFLSGLLLATVLSAQTTVSGTIQSGGLTREYLLYVPAVYSAATAVPLVINLHGYTSNNLAQALYGDFRAIADTANFLIVHPNGTIDGVGNRFWNTFGGTSTVDDVGFIANLIDSLRAVYNIDPNRVYATGMSNGGFMSYTLACNLQDRIAAIASVTGSMIAANLAACHPTRPVPVMEIHGDADNTVPYNGGGINFVPIPTLVTAWVGFNHCNPTPTITSVPNTNTADGCTAQHSLYTGGDLGSTVEHYRIIGGGHTWPGAVFNIGVTNQDINASREIWRFFQKYRLDELTTATRETATASWKAFPNPVTDELILQPAANAAAIERVQVYNAQGQLMQSIRVAPGETNLRVSTAGWANGAYKLLLESTGGIETIPVIKHRP